MTSIDDMYVESMRLDKALDDVVTERGLQDVKFGVRNHRDGTGRPTDSVVADRYRELCQMNFRNGEGTWRDVLLEEVYEALDETSPDLLRAELIQVAAVAVAWVQAVDRRIAAPAPIEGQAA